MREAHALLPCSSFIEIDAIKRMLDPTGSSTWRRQLALDISLSLTDALLTQGRSVITETHSRWPEQVERFRAVAHSLPEVVFTSFLVTAPYEVCLQRATARQVPEISYPIDTRMVSAYYTGLDPLPGEVVIDTSAHSAVSAARCLVESLTSLQEKE